MRCGGMAPASPPVRVPIDSAAFLFLRHARRRPSPFVGVVTFAAAQHEPFVDNNILKSFKLFLRIFFPYNAGDIYADGGDEQAPVSDRCFLNAKVALRHRRGVLTSVQHGNMAIFVAGLIRRPCHECPPSRRGAERRRTAMSMLPCRPVVVTHGRARKSRPGGTSSSSFMGPPPCTVVRFNVWDLQTVALVWIRISAAGLGAGVGHLQLQCCNAMQHTNRKTILFSDAETFLSFCCCLS